MIDMFAPVDPAIKEKVLAAYLAGTGRNQICRALNGQGIKLSHGSVSNIINAYKREHESLQQKSSSILQQKQSEVDIGGSLVSPTGLGTAVTGPPWLGEEKEAPATQTTPAKEDDVKPESPVKTTDVITEKFVETIRLQDNFFPSLYGATTMTRKTPREPDNIVETEDLFTDTNKLIYNYSPALHKKLTRKEDQDSRAPLTLIWCRMLREITREKFKIKKEKLVIDRRKEKLLEWMRNLDERESDLREREPFLEVAKKLQETKLTLEDCIPWIEIINEVAQVQRITVTQAATSVAQDIRLSRQLRDIEKEIELKNQELGLIDMATIKKKQAITVVEDLLESQIINLVKFAGKWDGYWNWLYHQQCSGKPTGNRSNNGYGVTSPLSGTDLIKLNLLQLQTSNMLNKMAGR